MLSTEINVKCNIPEKIPDLKLDFQKTYRLALENNPTFLSQDQQILEKKQSLDQIKSQQFFTGRLNANYGITGYGEYFADSYFSPDEYQRFAVSLEIPLLDWGKRRGNYLMAKSQQDELNAQIEQDRINFEQNIYIKVTEFNLQEQQVKIAAKADTIADLGYNVTKQRFYIDKVDVIRLNSARNSLENAKNSYINALSSFWESYFEMRSLCLYDFQKGVYLSEDFDNIVNEQRFK